MVEKSPLGRGSASASCRSDPHASGEGRPARRPDRGPNHGKLVAEGTAAELKRLIPGSHIRMQFADTAGLESAARTLGDVSRDDEARTLQYPATAVSGE